MIKSIRKLTVSLVMAGMTVSSMPAASQPLIYKPGVHPRHYPHRHFQQPYVWDDDFRFCTRSVRQWVPTRFSYDRWGNVDRVRGRHVRTLVRVPC